MYSSSGLKTFLFIACMALVVLAPGVSGAAGKKRAFVVSHFHYDPVWTNSQAGETMRAFSIIHQDLEYARLEPRFKFVLSELDYIKPYWDAYPLNREALMSLIRDGRVEFTGGYSEPDESEVGGEALIRNFVYGKIYKESRFGVHVFSGAQLDVFGHAVQLPQILRKSGYDFEMHSRGNLTDMPSEFYWLAPDGSTTLTKRLDYGGMANETVLAAHDKKYFDLSNNAMIMSGGDFTPPDRSIGSLLKNTKSYQVINGFPSEFFKAVLKETSEEKKTIPFISRDQAPLLPGCYSSRIDTKLANRLAENTLTDAEKFSTLAALYGAEYPWAALDKAWRILLFGQHHDGLTGSDAENVNLDLLASWREAVDIASSVRTDALSYLASRAKADAFPGKSNIRPIAVFNSLNWERTEPVEVTQEWPDGVTSFAMYSADTKFQIPYQILSEQRNAANKIVWAKFVFIAEKVPSMGYTTYYLAENEPWAMSPYAKKYKDTSISNEFYVIRADPARGGGITSIVERSSKKEYINPSAGVGNEFYAIKENNDKVEGPWSIHSTGQTWRSGDYPADQAYVEVGPVFSRIWVETQAVKSKVKIFNGADKVLREEDEETLPHRVQETILYKNCPRIDFRMHIMDYKQTDFLFKVGFPADVKGALPVFEERFAAVGRDMNDQDFLFYDFWREPGVKKGREYPTMNWVDLTAPALLRFEENGQTKSSFALAIGELVTPGDDATVALANKLATALARKGVTTTPTLADLPRTNEYYGFRVALGAAGSNKYSKGIIGRLDDARRKRLEAAIDKNGFGYLFITPIESVTSTPDKKKIPVLIVEAKDAASLDKAVSALAGDLESTGGISLPEETNEAIAGEVENAGLALFNNGQPGNSVEHNGTITLTLLRSSTSWPSGGHYSRNFETENWNHLYHYALLPHQGNWMTAKVWRTGHEFNNPLVPVVEKTQHGGAWPKDMALMETSGVESVISALKFKGYPYAEGKEPVAKGAPQIVLRMYNPTSFGGYGSAKFDYHIKSAFSADMLENPGAELPVENSRFTAMYEPFSIETFVIGAKKVDRDGPAVTLGPAVEAISPLNVRFWETNMGVAAIGNQPFAMSLEPGAIDEQKKTMDFRVIMANNSGEKPLKGTIDINAPGKIQLAAPMDYNLAPGATATISGTIADFDASGAVRSFVSAQTEVGGQKFEDAMELSQWKVFEGEADGAEKPEFDDSSWKTMQLARFWSQGPAHKGVTWYRRSFVIPKGMGDIPIHFERAPGAEIKVFINGWEARTEKEARSYSPLVGANIKNGEENAIAVRIDDPAGAGNMWGSAFEGSEPVFTEQIFKIEPQKLALAPGQKAKVKVTIFNPFGQKLDGAVQLISPIETWPNGGPFSILKTSPAAQNFSLPAGPLDKGAACEDAAAGKPCAKQALEFEVSAAPDAMPGTQWMVFKLIYAGRTGYSEPVDIIITK